MDTLDCADAPRIGTILLFRRFTATQEICVTYKSIIRSKSMSGSRVAAAAAAMALAFAATGALAGEVRNSSADEAQIVSSAKLSMGQALTAAEQATGGKAVAAAIEDQDGTAYFEVTILKDGVRHKTLVDTQTGEVAKTVTADNDDEGDENDSDNRD